MRKAGNNGNHDQPKPSTASHGGQVAKPVTVDGEAGVRERGKVRRSAGDPGRFISAIADSIDEKQAESRRSLEYMAVLLAKVLD